MYMEKEVSFYSMKMTVINGGISPEMWPQNLA